MVSKSRLQLLPAAAKAMLTGGAGSFRDVVASALGDFYRDPSAKNYRALEVALVEYQQRFQQYEDETRVAKQAPLKVKRESKHGTGCSACDEGGYAYSVEGLDGHVNACSEHVQQVAADALADQARR